MATKGVDNVNRIKIYSEVRTPVGPFGESHKLFFLLAKGEEYNIYCYKNLTEISDLQSDQILTTAAVDRTLKVGSDGTNDGFRYIFKVC